MAPARGKRRTPTRDASRRVDAVRSMPSRASRGDDDVGALTPARAPGRAATRRARARARGLESIRRADAVSRRRGRPRAARRRARAPRRGEQERRGRARGGDQGARRGRLRAARRELFARVFPGRRRRLVAFRDRNRGRRGRRAGDACTAAPRAGRVFSERLAARRRSSSNTRTESAIEFRRRGRRPASDSARGESAALHWSTTLASTTNAANATETNERASG